MAISKRRSAEPHPKPPIDSGLPTDIKLPGWEAALSYGSLLLAFVLVVRGIASSLWLDETATYWVIKDGLNNLFPRAWEWTGASALYDLTAWASHFLAPVIGFEVALRLPSVLATVVAVYLIYQLGRRLADRRAGLLSAIAFLCIYQVAFAAIDARPYALGLALLLASSLYFLKFLESPKLLYAIVYVAASALVVYTHYLLALGLVAQLIYGWCHRRKLASLWLAVGALCLPLSGHVLNLYNTRKAHSFTPPPGAVVFPHGDHPACPGCSGFPGGHSIRASGRPESPDSPLLPVGLVLLSVGIPIPPIDFHGHQTVPPQVPSQCGAGPGASRRLCACPVGSRRLGQRAPACGLHRHLSAWLLSHSRGLERGHGRFERSGRTGRSGIGGLRVRGGNPARHQPQGRVVCAAIGVPHLPHVSTSEHSDPERAAREPGWSEEGLFFGFPAPDGLCTLPGSETAGLSRAENRFIR